MTFALGMPFDGLPLFWQLLFTAAFVVIAFMLVWTTLLFFRGAHARTWPPDAPPEGADAFTWVFLVPALNEAVTIRDSVSRLLEMPVARRHIVVIDDGSDDGTAELLATMPAPGLHILRRKPPDARLGKAAALNHAYRGLAETLGEAGIDRSRVIVVIVDADGRLSTDAPRFAAAQFALDEHVGGVQALVRIYNRDHWLTRLQDIEFGVYGYLYQAGRTDWGAAGMGGNGQFNRLAALDAVAGDEGPWRDRLTEDQDLGIRLIGAGWEGRQELRAVVEQQGLPGLRRLLRQRTRWSQGNLQAMGLLGVLTRAKLPVLARIDQVAYLLQPLFQGLIGAALVGSLALLIFDVTPLWDDAEWWQLLFFYVLGFGGVMLGCIARRRCERAARRAARHPHRPGLRVLLVAAVAGAHPRHRAPAHRAAVLVQDRTRGPRGAARRARRP